MYDVPLLFGIISQDYMHPRKSQEQTTKVLSTIYEQLGSSGYLKDMSSSVLHGPSGEEYVCVCVSKATPT